MQDIREVEFRDSGSIANTGICFEVRATALRLLLHIEGFSLCPHRTSHTMNLTEDLANTNLEYTTPLLTQSPLHKEGLAQSQSKEKLQLGDLKDHKQLLVITINNKHFFSPKTRSYR